MLRFRTAKSQNITDLWTEVFIDIEQDSADAIEFALDKYGDRNPVRSVARNLRAIALDMVQSETSEDATFVGETCNIAISQIDYEKIAKEFLAKNGYKTASFVQARRRIR